MSLPPPVLRQFTKVPANPSAADFSGAYNKLPAALFPPGCLVFVRNVHPGTNKTTLRALLAAHAPAAAPALDYVDYTKGMVSVRVLRAWRSAGGLADARPLPLAVPRPPLDPRACKRPGRRVRDAPARAAARARRRRRRH